jgi:polysaccharide chain length determinant protein (PEP-CTERM system associated)
MELQDFIQIFHKRKWVIILSLLSVFLIAGVYTVASKEMYQSTTTILSIPQQVPENFVRSTVTVGVEGRLSTIQQQITSRTRLIKVMSEMGLFTQARKEGFENEAAANMAKRITVEVADPRSRGGRSESEAFSISFLHEDPMLAMLTTSRLASLFIEENVKLREVQAVGTSEFLETQLKETKAKLEAQEEKVKEYKLRYAGGLPEELRVNLSNLDRLQSQDRSISDEIRFAGQRKAALISQLNMLQKGARSVLRDDGSVEVDTSEDAAIVIGRELNLKRSQLVELSAKFTDKYPDVMRMRGEVEELEKKLASISESSNSKKGNDDKVADSRTYLPLTDRERGEYRNVKDQILNTDAELDALKRERASIRRNLVALQGKVEQSPRRDQEMITITRDYENLKDQYNDLLKKKTEADISKDLELRMKGVQFQVLDPANLPQEPSIPNKKKIFALAFLMAGFLGFGGAIGLEKIDLSLRGVTDFKHFFDIPILASIPILETSDIAWQQKLRGRAKLAGIFSIAFALFAILLFITLRFNIF